MIDEKEFTQTVYARLKSSFKINYLLTTCFSERLAKKVHRQFQAINLNNVYIIKFMVLELTNGRTSYFDLSHVKIPNEVNDM